MKCKDNFLGKTVVGKETTVSDDVVEKFPKPSSRLSSIIQEVPSTCHVLYLYKQNRGISKEWKWWAMEMIEKGLQTSNIIQLAGEDLEMNSSEFASLANTIFQELKLDVSDDDVYYQYVLWVAHQVLDGAMLAEDGLKKLAQAAVDTNYHNAFMDFYYLEDNADLLRGHLPGCYGDGNMREDNIEEWMHLYFEKLIKRNE